MLFSVVAFAVELPFMHANIFEGPIARTMGGFDLAWMVRPLVSVPLYLYLAKRKLKLRPLDLDLYCSTGSTATRDEAAELRAEGNTETCCAAEH